MLKNFRNLKPILISVVIGAVALAVYLVFKPTPAPSPTPSAPADYSPAEWSTENNEVATRSAEGSRCEGPEGLRCPPDYICLTSGKIPQAYGVCTKPVCPRMGYIPCMPEERNLEVGIYCTPEYSEWIQDNCPGVTLVY